MPKTQFAIEMGMGTDLTGEDQTKAACRAVFDALHRNSLTIGPAFGFPRDAMLVDIRVGVPDPGAVDTARVAAEAPYGTVTVAAVKGGARLPSRDKHVVVANAIISVSFDVEIAR
ncbi:Lin0512 family protein [Jannaschia sp. M317]|uniref:Lin0512 family protein n=1 Tax=Jannaschia sp. M317 TaxID=2867011 RepID=UPI0021A750EE|nr:Lin0512 family protein [Jannaschia sp. M317]UWQ18417.1 Lin0512 family protein [Jannaschia sp. M317]